MQSKITINPSVAVELDIGSISLEERVSIRFIADSEWTGEFELLVYNSIAKNSVIKPNNSLTIVGQLMTLIIDPLAQELADRVYYYEIIEKRSKRIIFKGNLKIIK